MKHITALAVFLSLTLPAYAEEKTIAVAYDATAAPVTSTIDIAAEYVAMEIAVSSSADTPSQRLKLTKKLLAALSLAATKDLSFEFQMGDVSSEPVDLSTTQPATSSNYYVFTNLRPNSDIYTATQDIYNFLKTVKKPSKTSITLGEVGLALAEPEHYRNQLLNALQKSLKRTQDVLGEDSTVTLTGLENPVYLRRKDDKKITLFLDYKMRIEL